MKNKLAITAVVAALVLALLWAAHHVDAIAFLRQLHGG
jgi:hypothetical protein